jgi:hypothetical protein
MPTGDFKKQGVKAAAAAWLTEAACPLHRSHAQCMRRAAE